jgi:periplasmic copper chaperone A
MLPMKATLSAVILMVVANSAKASDSIEISKAWTITADHKRADVPLFMTVTNHANEADALVRGRCDVATFVEKHVVDHGEGAPAMRAVQSIPIASATDTLLQPDGPHIMLLQTTRPLGEGEAFDCTLTFRKSGSVGVQVTVKPSGAGAAR